MRIAHTWRSLEAAEKSGTPVPISYGTCSCCGDRYPLRVVIVGDVEIKEIFDHLKGGEYCPGSRMSPGSE